MNNHNQRGCGNQFRGKEEAKFVEVKVDFVK